jgi:hypothetical protein
VVAGHDVEDHPKGRTPRSIQAITGISHHIPNSGVLFLLKILQSCQPPTKICIPAIHLFTDDP